MNMVSISIYLFGKPEYEIDTEKAKPEEFRKLGEDLKNRLERAAEIIEKLEKAGWERSGGLYDVFFYKDIKLADAKKELKKLGIKEDEITIEEDEEIEEGE